MNTTTRAAVRTLITTDSADLRALRLARNEAKETMIANCTPENTAAYRAAEEAFKAAGGLSSNT